MYLLVIRLRRKKKKKKRRSSSSSKQLSYCCYPKVRRKNLKKGATFSVKYKLFTSFSSSSSSSSKPVFVWFGICTSSKCSIHDKYKRILTHLFFFVLEVEICSVFQGLRFKSFLISFQIFIFKVLYVVCTSMLHLPALSYLL